ncbi:Pre-mRNA 3'-end-processing factor FIP1 [Schistosoma japonicum]|nr:Pre-mRNA 3'-end-processing factor FIP1 [Schistosoma japonicum]
MDNETLSAVDGCIIDNADSSAADANQISGEDIQTEAVDELRLHENDSYPYVEEEKNAVIAAAVADFDVDDHCEENDGDDDTVNVIIKPSSKTGIYKTGATYQARSVSHTTQHQKASRQGVELDDPGNINGIPTIEYNLSALGDEDKPWKRPGADITDYFNYGFTEETWIQYCEKQKILRQEYANTTLKPVLSSSGTNLLQRIRSGTVSSNTRQYDSSKQASINVINLSGSGLNARYLNSVPNSKAGNSPSDVSTRLLNGTTNNSSSLLNQFNQPPPGYLGGTQQANGNTTGTGTFNLPPPGFGSLTPGTNPQVLNATNPAAAAAALFPNLAVPPPVVNSLAGWPTGNIALSGLIASGDAIIDPITGQISGIIDHGERSPGSIYSNEDPMSRRGRRHYHPDELGYYEREGYRSRHRSRSSSRERYHSRHRRHRDSSRSGRDYERRRGTSRHSRRSRDDRHSGGVAGSEEHNSTEVPSPNTSGIGSHKSSGRRSDRDRPCRDRSRERERSRHRSERREHERSVRPSRQSDRHSSRRKEQPSPPRPSVTSSDKQATTKADPLSAAAAAAANIAAALGATNSSSKVS